MIRTVLVDDAESYRLLVRSVLEQAGPFEVVGEAGDGRQGIAVARETRPDLVLLDLSMPVMDGVEALPRIREASPDSTVVILTGFQSEFVTQGLETAGAAAILEKGLDPFELVEDIQKICGQAAGPDKSGRKAI